VERHVKERLVGAGVLMAAAIILVPEMLSGPKRADEKVAARSDAPIKTYTIDLNRSAGAPAATPIEEAAPPPESEPPATVTDESPGGSTESERPSEASPPSTQTSPESTHTESAPVAQQNLPANQEPAKPVAPPAPPSQEPPRATQSVSGPAVASTPNSSTSGGWAVQLGSFASRVTAERMVKDLSGAGFDAFVMPVKSGANTLYRVRIGPFADRSAANDALASIKKRIANAALVAHP
jgi:DedD protein